MPKPTLWTRFIIFAAALAIAAVLIPVRDLGYFLAGTILVFSVSGIALNHADDWNPNFTVERRVVPLDLPQSRQQVTREEVLAALQMLSAQAAYRTHDFPTDQRIKI